MARTNNTGKVWLKRSIFTLFIVYILSAVIIWISANNMLSTVNETKISQKLENNKLIDLTVRLHNLELHSNHIKEMVSRLSHGELEHNVDHLTELEIYSNAFESNITEALKIAKEGKIEEFLPYIQALKISFDNFFKKILLDNDFEDSVVIDNFNIASSKLNDFFKSYLTKKSNTKLIESLNQDSFNLKSMVEASLAIVFILFCILLYFYQEYVVKPKKELNKEQIKFLKKQKQFNEIWLNIASKFENRLQKKSEFLVGAVKKIRDSSSNLVETILNSTTRAKTILTETKAINNIASTILNGAEEMIIVNNETKTHGKNSNDLIKQAIDIIGKTDAEKVALRKQVNNIVTLSEVIKELLEQINIIAINATIESVRAGSVGKGFGVVANEIKDIAAKIAELYQNSSNVMLSSKDISNNIIEHLEGVKKTIFSLNESILSVSYSVDEQDLNYAELSEHADNINKKLENIDQNTNLVLGFSREVHESSVEMVKLTAALEKNSLEFNAEVKAFLDEVKS